MFKKLFFLLLGLIFLFFLFFKWWEKETSPVNLNDKEEKVIVIPSGWGVNEIANLLQKEKLIKNKLVFKILVIKEGLADKLQAGDFRLSSSMNLYEIVQCLLKGSSDMWVTIPEGWRREQIAKRLKEVFFQHQIDFDYQDFLRVTENEEGYLFPDTYLIPKNSSIETIIRIFKDNFERKYNGLTNKTVLTKEQIVILASLLEREVKHSKDKPVVAGILIKRLKKGWPLQVDASVQYIKASKICNDNLECNWWPQVTKEDLETFDNLYNTYKNLGLPPKPICNPGLDSLRAAVAPQETDYWFYLSDLAGNIYFSKTLEEHEANIKKYLGS